jgi:hypothetical protein
MIFGYLQRGVLFVLLGIWALSSSVYAHQQKEAYITILFNPHTGNLEVNHRFLIHDAEHALNISLGDLSDLHSNLLTQERFASYLQKHFALADGQGTLLGLTMVGHEVEGKYFWLYQEMAEPKAGILRVRHSALQEIWPSQTNQINIEKDGWVRSVRLAKDDGWQELSLLTSSSN